MTRRTWDRGDDLTKLEAVQDRRLARAIEAKHQNAHGRLTPPPKQRLVQRRKCHSHHRQHGAKRGACEPPETTDVRCQLPPGSNAATCLLGNTLQFRAKRQHVTQKTLLCLHGVRSAETSGCGVSMCVIGWAYTIITHFIYPREKTENRLGLVPHKTPLSSREKA